MPQFLERDWLSDSISFSFGGTPFWNTAGWISSFSNPSATLTTTLNEVRSYIESKLDVHFSTVGTGQITTHNGNMVDPDIDGLTLHDLGNIATHADVYVRSGESGNFGLVLHEMGHALGLGHTTDYSNFALTVMNPNYTSAQLDNVTAFGQYDLAQLNGAFGSAASYTGNWTGTPWADTLFGGTGPSDAADGSETLWGMGGSDVLYGNGGNDTIYGGAGVNDAADAADTIYGGGGDDIIYANGGNDLIQAGPGNDTLFGGAGADTFAFQSSGGVDRIEGWDGSDILRIQSNINGTGIDTLAELQAAGHTDGSHLYTDLGGGNGLLTLWITSFGPGDVEFV